MLTWGVVLERTRRFLSDQAREGRTPRHSDEELLDAWVDAQDDLSLYVARPATFSVAAGLTRATLPSDLYRIEFVKSADDYTMVALDAFESGDTEMWQGAYWYLTHTTIEFTTALEVAATVFYRAYYPAPTLADLDRPILIPRWAVQACLYYVTAQCIERQVVSDPQLRQYLSRTQDAGNPRDNPFTQVAEYMLKRYREQVTARTQDAQSRNTWLSSYL